MNLTNTQKTWLKTASEQEIKQFVSKGPAHTVQVINRETGELGFAAMIRGLRAANKSFKTDLEALTSAQQELNEIRREKDIETKLDEVALGIDGKNANFVELFDEHSLEIEEILHLASVSVICGHVSRFNDLERFMDAVLFDGAAHDSIKQLKPEYLDEIDEDVNTDEQYVEMLSDHLRRYGYYGFALSVKTPQRDYSGHSGGGYSFSYGICYLTWVYAETYEQAVNLAVEWAKKMAEDDKMKVEMDSEETE